ncbi:LytTR family two component transcriptional regulator [Saccharopolyspora erythraea NRRL 2338]|uniref:Two-component system response regulator n=2 Tax=Saccharopolyspora erythraea TaxID=1836 RepID=A4FIX0_SACEN|nr:LytTR family DNA-binding domain-containing protein [Saccharopolyspora erythraea]EQD83284.1 LytR family transcriptional regulator [Saccharopolyspora erythraea D]PFG97668.1 LytTR family two component transcriptional regulator [Saccharopolyspora erythraea NRRL 2338]QRK87824.1 response regulator transcription factor [Saccharopolyspora erythraea]CAM03995.1 putative two-component system response regulator [Saccharopolyspora erythraea NRRL 2338]
MPAGLRVLAVDDVAPALDELCRLLREAPEVAEVAGAVDAVAALKMIRTARFDAVFLDISMPGLDGLELATLLARLADPPAIVFVTAYDRHAVTAYDIGAVDYLLKPVRVERLAAALERVGRMLAPEEPASAEPPAPQPDAMAALPVEAAGRTRYVRRSEVRFAEAQGDYVRLHTPSGVHVVRMPISRLEEYWGDAGFSRVHRSFLVSLGAVRELRSDTTGALIARTDVGDVPVSRRHARDLRERLLRDAQRSELARSGRGE